MDHYDPWQRVECIGSHRKEVSLQLTLFSVPTRLSSLTLTSKVSRGNSGRGVNSGHALLFSGEEGLHSQTWYAG